MAKRENNLENSAKPVRGRIISIENQSITLANAQHNFYITLEDLKCLNEAKIGDIVEVQKGNVQVLTSNLTSQRSTYWLNHTSHPRRLHGTQVRRKIEKGIRLFFENRGFLETQTSLLVPCPGMEPHIRPFTVGSTYYKKPIAYLPTSPEFAMKRLLVGGLENIFQICPAFRDEPHSTTHLPEFTILEWYRAYANDEEIMKDTEGLLEYLAIELFGKPEIHFQGKTISVKTPWPRLRVRDLFQEYVGINLVEKSTALQLAKECKRLGLSPSPEDTWDDLYFRIWLNLIEPKLPEHQAVFVTRYPASQAALAVVDSDPDGSKWARRFEVYAGGLELGNAFEELTDPIEQRKRFKEDMNLRQQIYGSQFPKNPLDESFLHALTEGMPPSGGIAMGVDRLVMLYADEPDIEFTTWLSFDKLCSPKEGS